MIRNSRSVCAAWIGVLALGIPAVCSCRPDSKPAAAGGPLRVYVSIAPQKYFVERVGGRHVQVSVLLRAGQSPHNYEPTPKEMVALSSAQVFFRAGVPFENQVVEKLGAARKDLDIVDTREGLELDAGKGAHDEGKVDGHGSHDGHGHGGDEDPHVWMNPRLVKVQARTICKALCRLDPAHRAAYEKNCQRFEADLDDVDARIAAALAPLRGRTFYVFHPAFGHFAQAYGLKQAAVETEGKPPTGRQLGRLIERAKAAGVKLIFVQPQFSKRSAEVVARELGGAVVPLDPLAEDYISNLLKVASQVKAALTDDSTGGADEE